MIDEKVIYGGLSASERQAKKVQYWAWHLHQDLVTLNNRIHAAKKELTEGELGVIGELDVQSLITQIDEIGEIDFAKMSDMDSHRKVKWIADGI